MCIFTVAYLARPLGGLLMAHWADRYGRKRAFTLSITMMALPCFVIGLMPTYAEVGYVAPALLLVLRMIQGLRSGAKFPAPGCLSPSMRRQVVGG